MKLELGVTQKEAEELAGGDFEVLPVDKYEGSCCQITDDPAKSGSPMLTWTFEIINNPDFAGRKLKSYTVINEDESKNFGLYQHLAALGLSLGKDGTVETDDALGRTCIVDVTQGMYKEKMVNNIKTVYTNK